MRTSTVKSIAALALTGAGSALVLGFRTTGTALDASAAPGAGAAGSSTSQAGGTSSGSNAGSGSGSSSDSGSSTAAYADGTWTGSEVSEPWGPFEVQVVVSGGTIANVTVVESPSDRHSSRINDVAVPILTRATMAAQDASVDMVSGATWTSDSYATSLQSALDKAAQAA
jgi:uncharacterized protein with FMN-binding domain